MKKKKKVRDVDEYEGVGDLFLLILVEVIKGFLQSLGILVSLFYSAEVHGTCSSWVTPVDHPPFQPPPLAAAALLCKSLTSGIAFFFFFFFYFTGNFLEEDGGRLGGRESKLYANHC